MEHYPSRRIVIASLFAATSLPLLSRSASAFAPMIVHRDPGCGCCEGWVAHVRAAGFDAKTRRQPGAQGVELGIDLGGHHRRLVGQSPKLGKRFRYRQRLGRLCQCQGAHNG